MIQLEKIALSVKISQQAKSALKSAADQEQKNMTDMLEKIITTYCERNRIPISELEVSDVCEQSMFFIKNIR